MRRLTRTEKLHGTGFNIREWELKNPRQFQSLKAAGNSITEIILPDNFNYGNYLYVRDVLFLYKNNYTKIVVNLIEMRGDRQMNRWHFFLDRYESNKGSAYFIDQLLKPKFNHTYYVQIMNLPEIPPQYKLFYKLHFRFITKMELKSIEEPPRSYFEDTLIV